MKRTLDTVIVDRDPRGRERLYQELAKHPSIQVIGEARNSIDGYGVIQKLNPDVVFVNVGGGLQSGFELLDRFENESFFTVVSSGVPDFAHEAMKRGAVDYLMKPFEHSEVLRCVSRLQDRLFSQEMHTQQYQKLEVYCKGSHHFIPHSEIIFIEASGAYSVLRLTNGERMLVSKNLKRMLEDLGEQYFYRIHNSYIVNLLHISQCHFNRKQCRLHGGHIIQMAVRRSDGLRKRLADLWTVYR